MCLHELRLPPHHLVHDARVALDELDDLRGNVAVRVGGHLDPVVAVGVHGDGQVHGCLGQSDCC